MFFIFLAEGFEEIEAITTIDVLRRGGVEVVCVGIGGKNITGAHAITVTADVREDALRSFPADMEGVILPGGMPGTKNLKKSGTVMRALGHCIQNSLYIAAICAAPSVPGELGLLAGVNATCFPGFETRLSGARIVDAPVVTDGKFITSKGPGTTIAFALEILALLKGSAVSQEVQRTMQCQ